MIYHQLPQILLKSLGKILEFSGCLHVKEWTESTEWPMRFIPSFQLNFAPVTKIWVRWSSLNIIIDFDLLFFPVAGKKQKTHSPKVG